MKKIVKFIIDWIWQFPQNLLGILLSKTKKDNIITEISNDDIRDVEAIAYLIKVGSTMTFGRYMFISQTYKDQSVIIKHECEHVKKSKKLGPLYLMVFFIKKSLVVSKKLLIFAPD